MGEESGAIPGRSRRWCVLALALAIGLAASFDPAPARAQEDDAPAAKTTDKEAPKKAGAEKGEKNGKAADAAAKGEEAEGEETAPAKPAAPPPFKRNAGYYFAWWKLLLVVLVFYMWIAHASWVNADTFYNKIDHRIWNAATVGGFLLSFMLMLFIPWFAVGFFLLLIGDLGPVLSYVFVRNKQLPSHEKVLTLPHLRFWFAEKLRPLGIKIEAEKQVGKKKSGPPVEFKAQGGGSQQQDQINQLTAKQLPGYDLARELVAQAEVQRAQGVRLDYTAEAVAVAYEVDGVWHPQEPLAREPGDQMLAVFKKLANLNEQERRKKQSGAFQAELMQKKYACHIASEGTPTGERAEVRLDDGAVKIEKVVELGMRDKAAESLVAAAGEKAGLVIISAPPGHGLRTTFPALVRSLDRYMRSFVQIDAVNDPTRETENVPITTFDPAKNESPATVLPGLIRKYPDAYVVRNVVNLDTLNILLGEVEDENRLVITSVRAKDSAEAILRVASLKAPLAKLAKSLRAVTNQRLARRLCMTCREAFEPTPQLLKQLGIPAGKVQQLYRPPQNPEKPCPECQGLGYFGRVPIFETLIVTDEVRKALTESPKLETLRAAIRKAGTPTLQEEGILIVAKGETSLEELKRVLTI